MPLLRLPLACVLLLASFTSVAAGQGESKAVSQEVARSRSASATFEDEVGNLGVRRDHREWPLPETVVTDLRSSDEKVRLRALDLLGVTEKQAHQAIWGTTSPSTVIGNKVVFPDEVKLMYAALGNDGTQYAIVAVLLRESQLTFAAVASPTSHGGWKRIATFDCWCKYEMLSAKDVLDEFVGLHQAPESSIATPAHFELVLRASGGGTGIYTLNEAHFRARGGELRRVLSFVSRYRLCDQTGPDPRHCTTEVRWLVPASVNHRAGRLLVESRGRYLTGNGEGLDNDFRALEHRYLPDTKCRRYEWDESNFRYAPAGSAGLCTPSD